MLPDRGSIWEGKKESAAKLSYALPAMAAGSDGIKPDKTAFTGEITRAGAAFAVLKLFPADGANGERG